MTREAEAVLERVWGKQGQGPALMLEAGSLEDLLNKGQRLAPVLKESHAQGLSQAMLGPWDLAPTGKLAKQRLEKKQVVITL